MAGSTAKPPKDINDGEAQNAEGEGGTQEASQVTNQAPDEQESGSTRQTQSGDIVLTPGLPVDTTAIQIEVPAEYADQFRALLANLRGNQVDGLRQAVAQQHAAIAGDKTTTTAAEQALKAHEQRLEAMGVDPGDVILSPDMAFREIRVRDKLLARAKRLDYAPNGGQTIMPDGTLVWNLTGRPVEQNETMPKELFVSG